MASRLLKISNALKAVPQRYKSSHAGDFAAALSASTTTEISQLDNGVRVASINTGSATATVGLWLDAGSRYEDADNNGVANFLSRLIFKGTTKRGDLETEVANLGGQLTACTTREQTAYYATCLSNDVPKLVEILSDAIQNPKLDDAQIERVRKVLLTELDQSDNNVPEVVFNQLHQTAYAGTPLGQSVLGTTENLKSISKSDLRNYIDNHFKSSRIVLTAAGGVDHNALVSAGQQNLNSLDNSFDGSVPILTPCRFTGSEIRLRDDSVPLAHCAIAVQTDGVNSSSALPLLVASAVIGSWDRTRSSGAGESSALARSSATDGYSESFQSFVLNYNGTGLFGLYFASDPLMSDYMVLSTQNIWKTLSTSVPEADVQRAKNLLKTNLLLQLDSTTGLANEIGRQVLQGNVSSVAELISKIDKVSADSVREACYNATYDVCPAVSAVGSIECIPEYARLRANTYGAIW